MINNNDEILIKKVKDFINRYVYNKHIFRKLLKYY